PPGFALLAASRGDGEGEHDDDDRGEHGPEEQRKADQSHRMPEGDRISGPCVRTDRHERFRGHRRIRGAVADPRKEREAPGQDRDADGEKDESQPEDEDWQRGEAQDSVDPKARIGDPDVEKGEQPEHLQPGQNPIHSPPGSTPLRTRRPLIGLSPPTSRQPLRAWPRWLPGWRSRTPRKRPPPGSFEPSSI